MNRNLLGLIAYDCTLYKPACVILSAALGANPELAKQFPSELWLVNPTPDMKVYEVLDQEFLEALIVLTIERHSNDL